jgi:hypothetical protein
MVNNVFIDMFDTKTIDYQCEQDGSCFVTPQSQGMRIFRTPKWRKFVAEAFVCQNTGLWQAPHCLPHFQMDKPICHVLAKVELFDDPLREQGKEYFHTLKIFEHCCQVEVLYTMEHVFCKGSADDTVPMECCCI